MPVRMLRERRSTDLLRVAPYIVLLGALGWSMLGYCQSPESSARLVAAGLDLFPSVLAADLDLENKTDAEGRLRLCLVYRDDVAVAERLAAKLREIDEIQGLPIQVHILDTKELKSMVNDPSRGPVRCRAATRHVCTVVGIFHRASGAGILTIRR